MELKERILQVMDKKRHSSVEFFHRQILLDGQRATLEQYKMYCRQEFEVFVRDFPSYLDAIVEKNPPEDMKRELTANAHEERHGKIEGITSHVEMYLHTMMKLGFSRDDFKDVELLPESRAYKQWIRDIIRHGSALEASVVVNIFVEGSYKDRQELDPSKPPVDVKEVLENHPLVLHFGLKPQDLPLKRRHLVVEDGHRQSAHGFSRHADTEAKQRDIVEVLRLTLSMWNHYRNGVAAAYSVPGYHRLREYVKA